MPGFLSKYFPKRRLEGISKTTWVEVPAVVGRGPLVRSMLSGLEAVAIRISWVEGQTAQGGNQSRGGTLFSNVIASAWLGLGIPLVAGERTIDVTTRGLRLVAPVDPQDASPIAGAMPREFQYLLEGPRTGGLYFREHALYTGDPVRLRAQVSPVPRAGGYREMGTTAPTADFVVAEGTDAVLHDLSLEGH